MAQKKKKIIKKKSVKKKKLVKRSKASTDKSILDEIIRVDHAGEYGATRIYEGRDVCGGIIKGGTNTQQVSKVHRLKFVRASVCPYVCVSVGFL